jgi:hypothetical protein
MGKPDDALVDQLVDALVQLRRVMMRHSLTAKVSIRLNDADDVRRIRDLNVSYVSRPAQNDLPEGVVARLMGIDLVDGAA